MFTLLCAVTGGVAVYVLERALDRLLRRPRPVAAPSPPVDVASLREQRKVRLACARRAEACALNLTNPQAVDVALADADRYRRDAADLLVRIESADAAARAALADQIARIEADVAERCARGGARPPHWGEGEDA